MHRHALRRPQDNVDDPTGHLPSQEDRHGPTNVADGVSDALDFIADALEGRNHGLAACLTLTLWLQDESQAVS